MKCQYTYLKYTVMTPDYAIVMHKLEVVLHSSTRMKLDVIPQICSMKLNFAWSCTEMDQMASDQLLCLVTVYNDT